VPIHRQRPALSETLCEPTAFSSIAPTIFTSRITTIRDSRDRHWRKHYHGSRHAGPPSSIRLRTVPLISPPVAATEGRHERLLNNPNGFSSMLRETSSSPIQRTLWFARWCRAISRPSPQWLEAYSGDGGLPTNAELDDPVRCLSIIRETSSSPIRQLGNSRSGGGHRQHSNRRRRWSSRILR